MERYSDFMKRVDFRPGDFVRGTGIGISSTSIYLDQLSYVYKLFAEPTDSQNFVRRLQTGKLKSSDVALVLEVIDQDVRVISSDGCGWIWKGNIVLIE